MDAISLKYSSKCTDVTIAGTGCLTGERKLMSETANEVVKRYLEDAIAAEKSFETQLDAFSKEGDNLEVRAAFAHHSVETKSQYQRLEMRLEALGGTSSPAKSFLAHLFGALPQTAKIGHLEEERTTQNLMIAFAVENSELAMYEALATVAEAAGDAITAKLAREIQKEEKAAAEIVWKHIPLAAAEAFVRVITPPYDSAATAAGGFN
jgi:ferritin-like metal-binding protein YciE